MTILCFEGGGGDRERLASKALLLLALSELMTAARMTPIGEPEAGFHTAASEIDSGPSAYRLMAESNVSLHAFPNAGYLMGTVASCKPIADVDGALEGLRRRFGLGWMRHQLVDIGTLPSLQRTLEGWRR